MFTSERPLLSIIIPAYNCDKYIGRCLRSLSAQTFPSGKFEVIVINDGSQDNTSEILKRYSSEIIIINNSTNFGLPAALNTGIKKAEGQYIIRVDADDYVHKEYLNILFLHLSLNKDMDAVACDYYLVDDQERVLRQVNCEDEPIGCGIMFRIEHLISIGLYNETFLRHEDKELRKRFQEKFEIDRVQLPLYRYRRHEKNITNDTKEMQFYSKKLQEDD